MERDMTFFWVWLGVFALLFGSFSVLHLMAVRGDTWRQRWEWEDDLIRAFAACVFWPALLLVVVIYGIPNLVLHGVRCLVVVYKKQPILRNQELEFSSYRSPPRSSYNKRI